MPQTFSLVGQLHLDGTAAWPQLVVDERQFVLALRRYLDRALAEHNDADPVAILRLCDGGEIAAVAAIAHGGRNAIEAVDRRYLPIARNAVRKLNVSDELIATAENRVREKLFVVDPQAGTPGLDRFVGSGRLESFVRVVAVREAISLLRTQARAPELTDDGMIEMLEPSVDPSVSVIKHELREQFRTAFAAAIAGLAPRQRTCLRLHLLDGLTLEALATLHGVHRATICRWLEQRNLSTSLRHRYV